MLEKKGGVVMSRKDEIEDKAIDFRHSILYFTSARDMKVAYKSFKSGAEWADATMLDKVCKWLKENIDEDVLIKCGSVIKCMDADEFSEYLRKAMEE
jgi:Zn ribbon nucleic-acid-binding protein